MRQTVVLSRDSEDVSRRGLSGCISRNVKTPLNAPNLPSIPRMGRQCISYGNWRIIKGIAYTSMSSERLGRLKSNFAGIFGMPNVIT